MRYYEEVKLERALRKKELFDQFEIPPRLDVFFDITNLGGLINNEDGEDYGE